MPRKDVALTVRDIAILELLAERRAETLDFLHERFYSDAIRRTAQNRLAQLTRAGYLHRERVSLRSSGGYMEPVFTLGPRAQAALTLRHRGAEVFRGRRFNPTLRRESLDHQIITNRVGEWLGAELRHEHLLPAPGKGAAFRHRPDATYTAAVPDQHGRRTVFLEVDLGHYSRERILGKVQAFLTTDDGRNMLIVSPTPERAGTIGLWLRDRYGEAITARTQSLTFEQINAGGYIRPGTEPAPPSPPGDYAL